MSVKFRLSRMRLCPVDGGGISCSAAPKQGRRASSPASRLSESKRSRKDCMEKGALGGVFQFCLHGQMRWFWRSVAGCKELGAVLAPDSLTK